MSETPRHIPDEHQVESLLRGIQPQPSENFYARMKAAPWRQTDKGFKISFHMPDPPRLKAKLALAVLGVLLLAISGLFILPSVRATAQNILQFLLPADEDAITVPIKISYPDDINLFNTPAMFNLDLEGARQLAGYPLKEVTGLENELVFNGAYYDPQLERITIRYTGVNYDLFFSQRPIGNIEEYSKIGATAPVEIVNVHGVSAEYVHGGWKVQTTDNQVLETALPSQQVFVEAIWDATLPQNLLRWSEGGYLYELLSVGNPNIDRTAILDYANQVK